MSTPALIDFVDLDTGDKMRLYHHHDGYPDVGIGIDLNVLVTNLNNGWRWGYRGDSIIDLAHYVMERGLPGTSGVDHSYLDGSDDQDVMGDYIYTISKKGDSYSLSCRDFKDNDVTKEIRPYMQGKYGKRYEVRYTIGAHEYDSKYKKQVPFGGKMEYGQRTFVSSERDGFVEITRVLDKKKSRWKFKPLISLRRK